MQFNRSKPFFESRICACICLCTLYSNPPHIHSSIFYGCAVFFFQSLFFAYDARRCLYRYDERVVACNAVMCVLLLVTSSCFCCQAKNELDRIFCAGGSREDLMQQLQEVTIVPKHKAHSSYTLRHPQWSPILGQLRPLPLLRYCAIVSS